MNNSKIIEILKRHEGFAARAYYGPERVKTIGYGYNMDLNPLHLTIFELDRISNKGISVETAENLLIDLVYKIKFALDKEVPWWSKIDQPRKDAIMDIVYGLGINKLTELKVILDLIQHGDYEKASKEILNAKWTNRFIDRAEEISKIILNGSYLNA
jgi:lysozyme